MTFLEVHSEKGVYRWEIKGLPTGTGEEEYKKRLEVIGQELANYKENMSYAFPNAEIYIVHQSNFD